MDISKISSLEFEQSNDNDQSNFVEHLCSSKISFHSLLDANDDDDDDSLNMMNRLLVDLLMVIQHNKMLIALAVLENDMTVINPMIDCKPNLIG